jgi:hypothetical protein
VRRGSVKAGCNVGVRVDPELYHKVKTMANEHDLSVNALVTGILEEACRLRLALLEKRRNKEV